MKGISSKAAVFGEPENKKEYKQYKFNSDFDINIYESFYRSHDPQIGRFWQSDPKAMDEISLYASMENNIIKVGKGRATNNALTTGYPNDLPYEENKSSYIHTHPDGGNGTRFSGYLIEKDNNGRINGSRSISGQIEPDPSDADQSHSSRFKYRSVIVDQNYIYLFRENQKTIKIERHE